MEVGYDILDPEIRQNNFLQLINRKYTLYYFLRYIERIFYRFINLLPLIFQLSLLFNNLSQEILQIICQKKLKITSPIF